MTESLKDNYIKLSYKIVTSFLNNKGDITPEGMIELMIVQSEYEEGKYERLLEHSKAIANILNMAIKNMEEIKESEEK